MRSIDLIADMNRPVPGSDERAGQIAPVLHASDGWPAAPPVGRDGCSLPGRRCAGQDAEAGDREALKRIRSDSGEGRAPGGGCYFQAWLMSMCAASPTSTQLPPPLPV